jgi:catechol 2,3-dioxygenase-like lactoylglutathione lyase family enzyme
MNATIERLSAVTLKVSHMETSLRFYRDVLGLELFYGGLQSGFSSLRVPGTDFPVINLQKAEPIVDWGRVIFHVEDVDAFWTRLKEEGFCPNTPEDASWGERYFHVHDPDGHELSSARPL